MAKWKFWKIETETKLKSTLDDLCSLNEQLDKRLRKLECEHRLTNISKGKGWPIDHYYAYESCNSCNKILKLFSKEEFIKSRLKFYRKESKLLREKT